MKTYIFVVTNSITYVPVLPEVGSWRQDEALQVHGTGLAYGQATNCSSEVPLSGSPSLAIAKATCIDLFNYRKPAMRIFHTTWFAFFLCFFGWFGMAPLMAVVREELALTQAQIGNTIIASVAITIVARLVIGWVCDRFGPRITYTWLLLFGALPVMGIGLAQSYTSFLLFRLAIGVIGASFVITQYHTSVAFAPNVVGTANATTAGWGNLGGGVTQMAMPLIFALFVTLGFTDAISWRLAMVVPGIAMLVAGLLYWHADYLLDLKRARRYQRDVYYRHPWIAPSRPPARTAASVAASR